MRILKLFAIATIAVGLAACSGKKSSDVESEPVVEQTEIEEAEEPEEEETTLVAEEEIEEEEVEVAPTHQTSSSSEDWDALLNSYEEYVDKYIAFLKKAKAGDMSALAEYPALMQKAQEYADKLEKAKGDELTPAQMTRFNKIQMKMLEAAQQM